MGKVTDQQSVSNYNENRSIRRLFRDRATLMYDYRRVTPFLSIHCKRISATIAVALGVVTFVCIACETSPPADLRGTSQLDGFEHPVMDLHFASDDTLFCLDRKGTVYLAAFLPAPSMKEVVFTDSDAWRIECIRNYNAIAVGHLDGSVGIISREGLVKGTLRIDGGIVTYLAHSQNTNELAVASHDGVSDFGTGGNVEVWSMVDMKRVAKMKTDATPLSVAWRPGGETVAVGFYGGKVQLIGRDDMLVVVSTALVNPNNHRDAHEVAVSADGSHLAVAAGDSLVILDGTTLEQVAECPTEGVVTCAAWSPVENSQIAFAGKGCGVVVWNYQTNRMIPVFQSVDRVKSIRFAPKGDFLALAVGRQVRVLDVSSARTADHQRHP